MIVWAGKTHMQTQTSGYASRCSFLFAYRCQQTVTAKGAWIVHDVAFGVAKVGGGLGLCFGDFLGRQRGRWSRVDAQEAQVRAPARVDLVVGVAELLRTPGMSADARREGLGFRRTMSMLRQIVDISQGIIDRSIAIADAHRDQLDASSLGDRGQYRWVLPDLVDKWGDLLGMLAGLEGTKA